MNFRVHITVSVASLLLIACSDNVSKGINKKVIACSFTEKNIGSFVSIPEQVFSRNVNPKYVEERAKISEKVSAFEIQAHEVTNAQFRKFVEQTGYITDAEQGVLDGRVGSGSAVFRLPDLNGVLEYGWTLIQSANWQSPNGSASDIAGLDHHPVVHVSYQDAQAYAKWAGGRLPTELEWELAATLGLPERSDTVSGAIVNGKLVANTWQGAFPLINNETDGFAGSSPVGCFAASDIGLYDMIGNVWEWTSSPFGSGTHTIKGGSFLCSDNFCARYRPEARQPHEKDFSTNHIGFRVVRDVR